MSRSRAPRPRHGGARVCHDGYDAPTWATVSGGADAPVLATRALPLEHALAMLARVCREAAARVAWNGRLAEMNLDVPVGDERRIEAVTNPAPPKTLKSFNNPTPLKFHCN